MNAVVEAQYDDDTLWVSTGGAVRFTTRDVTAGPFSLRDRIIRRKRGQGRFIHRFPFSANEEQDCQSYSILYYSVDVLHYSSTEKRRD